MVEVEVPPGLIEIGETLRAARESHGLSLDTAAAQLRSDARVVEALEHGRFGELGPPVFARGHLLRYATLLGEPGEAMVEEWSRIVAGGTGAELMFGLQRPRGRDLRQVRRRLVIGAALLSLAAIVTWTLQQGSTRPVAVAPATVVASPSPAVPAPNPRPQLANASPPAVRRPVERPVAAAPAAESTVASVDPSGVVRLRFTFTAESWLEIYDVRNRKLFFGQASANSPVTVQGRAPLRVIVGNAPAATIELNGRPVALPAEAMRGRRAAALRINADGRLLALPRA